MTRGGGGTGADNGRYVAASNNGGADHFGTIYGAGESGSDNEHFNESGVVWGGGDINPFVEGGAVSTQNIVGLTGGADVYGLTDGVTADDAFFDAVRAGAPENAVAAIMRSGTGPNGDNYYGLDSLLMVNLTSRPLHHPRLGMSEEINSFTTPLLERGYENNPAFGGSGPLELTEIPAGGVYQTGITGFPVVKAIVGSGAATVAYLFEGDVEYITVDPLPGDYNDNGVVDAADYTVWRDHEGGPVGSLANDTTGSLIGAAQYNLWRNNYGATRFGSIAVPEPAAHLLGFLSAAAAFWRRPRY